MSDTDMSPDVRTETLRGDGLLANADDHHARLEAIVAAGRASTLDLSGMGATDISFVQLIVSAALTSERTGQPLALTGLSQALRVTFEKAGVRIDPIMGHITRD